MPDEKQGWGDGFACWILYINCMLFTPDDVQQLQFIKFLMIKESVVEGAFCRIGLANLRLGARGNIQGDEECQKLLDTTGDRRTLVLV